MKFYENGIVVGKFAPLTRGHINLINHASTQCKNLKVFLCYDDKFLNEQNDRDKERLTLKNRLLWLKKTFKDFNHIKIDYIDESNIGEYPNGWPDFVNLIKAKYNHNIPKDTALFSSEIEYDEGYKKYFPEIDHVVVDNDRTMVPISATKIRNNIYEHWDMLPSIVRKDYALKTCIIGTESCGKSTMVKYLAKLYNTSWVEEYGRTYIENELCSDESLLTSSDYEKIAFGHKNEEEIALRTANKVTFIDTNAFITEFYHRLYEGESNAIINQMAKKEDYDLILYLQDDVPWVKDNIRLNGNRRKETKELLDKMIEEFPNIKSKMVKIEGKDYNSRLQKAMKHVDKMLNSLSNGLHYTPEEIIKQKTKKQFNKP